MSEQSSAMSVDASVELPLNADDRVRQLKLNHLDKFQMLVTMHLSFLMDLSGTGLEEILEKELKVTNEKTKPLFALCKRSSKVISLSSKMFGTWLTQDSVNRIYDIIRYLGKMENVQKEGVFRVSGSLERQKELREWLDNRELPSILESKYFVHDYAAVLKNFLSELPEPLMMEKYYNVYLQIAGMKSQNKQIECLQLLIQLFPTENLLLLHHLVDLLNKISHQPQSKMTAENLAVLFTPHLIVPRKTPAAELQHQIECLQVIVVLMISKYDTLFSLPPPFVHDALHCYEEVTAAFGESSSSQQVPTILSLNRTVEQSQEDDDIVINTTYSFTDRWASQEAARHNSTESALSELYCHICQMPDSAQKKRILKEFSKVHGTPKASSEKLKMPHSIESTIKQLVRKRKRLIMSSEIIKENAQPEEPQAVHHTSFIQVRVPLHSDILMANTPAASSHNHLKVKQQLLCNNDSYSEFEFQESTAPIDLSGHFLSFSEETGEGEIRQTTNNFDVLSVNNQSDHTLSDKSCTITVSNDNILNNSVGCCHDENKENNCQSSASYVEFNGYISPLVFHTTVPRNSPQAKVLSSGSSKIELIAKRH